MRLAVVFRGKQSVCSSAASAVESGEFLSHSVWLFDLELETAMRGQGQANSDAIRQSYLRTLEDLWNMTDQV